MKIIVVHLFNDFSGSPKVMSMLVKDWTSKGIDVSVICSNTEGFLSQIPYVHYFTFSYNFYNNKFKRLVNYFISQVRIFFIVLKICRKEDTLYINTILPFGAALAGKIKSCKIIYHVHETSIKPALLKSFLFKIISTTASELIYVSKYLFEKENCKNVRSHIVYNAIETDFLAKAQLNNIQKDTRKNILMVCSLKDYKGIPEYVKLANLNPTFDFKIVVNANQEHTDQYFKKLRIGSNFLIYSTQTNLHPFYQWADIIVNLSRPNEWIETFGLTIIEGMAYGLPAIVPPVGGIAELVEDGKNGYKVNAKDTKLLNEKLHSIINSSIMYSEMSLCANEKINTFKEEVFLNSIYNILHVNVYNNH